MTMIRALAAALLAALMMTGQAAAQSAIVVLPSGCGTASFVQASGYMTMDASGKLCTSNGASSITPATSTALAANQVVKASAGNLTGFEVSADATLSAAAWWVMIFDAASAPVDGAVTPKKCYALPSGTTSYAASFTAPIAFTTGITISVSTSGCFTKAASTHAFISGDAQ